MNEKRWRAIEAFEYLGAATKDPYAWSAQSSDRTVTVLALWEDQIEDDGVQVTVEELGRLEFENWRTRGLYRRRAEHLRHVWETDRTFKVVLVRAADRNAIQRSARARWPDDDLEMQLTEFDPESGGYRAVGVRSSRVTGATWTERELRACVEAYRKHWDALEAGTELSKSQVRREVLRTALRGRSKSAYERRMQNISAVAEELGIGFVTGYPPLRNIGKPKEQIIALINEVWQRADQPEQPTADLGELETRVRAARLKVNRNGEPPVGSKTVARVAREGLHHVRDPEVVAWVLAQAGDRCEGCGSPAPFVREDGTPYLEVHHVRWLAQGGPDTTTNAVALCPNCHRRLHHGTDRNSFRRSIIARVDRILDHPKLLG